LTAYKLTDSDITGRGGTPTRPRSRKGYANVLSLGNTAKKVTEIVSEWKNLWRCTTTYSKANVTLMSGKINVL
jgi:hypothetical protein